MGAVLIDVENRIFCIHWGGVTEINRSRVNLECLAASCPITGEDPLVDRQTTIDAIAAVGADLHGAGAVFGEPCCRLREVRLGAQGYACGRGRDRDVIRHGDVAVAAGVREEDVVRTNERKAAVPSHRVLVGQRQGCAAGIVDRGSLVDGESTDGWALAGVIDSATECGRTVDIELATVEKHAAAKHVVSGQRERAGTGFCNTIRNIAEPHLL